jgi:PAS domain S-box-containing protein
MLQSAGTAPIEPDVNKPPTKSAAAGYWSASALVEVLALASVAIVTVLARSAIAAAYAVALAAAIIAYALNNRRFRQLQAAIDSQRLQSAVERSRVEAQLKETDERFKIAADSAGIGVWDLDVITGHVTWNEWMYRIYGLDQAVPEEPYDLWLNSLHADDRDRCLEDMKLALCGAKRFAPEFRIVRPDGEVRSITAAAQVVHAEDGTPRRMTGVNFDVTVQRSAEQKMRAASSLLRTVLDCTAEISIIATDPGMIIRVFNAGAERLLGYTSEEVVGRVTPSIMHDAEEIRNCCTELSAQLGYTVDDEAVFAKPPLQQRPREWTYVRKDGGRLTVSMVVTPMYAEGGELLGYVCVAHDVTQQHRYEDSLRTATGKSEQANRAKSEFLANMSHEIRTPLNAIIGLGYLLEQTTLTADQHQFLAKIQFAGRALLGVINDVLDLSKVESGEMTLETAQFDLPALVRDLGAMLAPQAVDKGIELVVECPTELPRMVHGDAVRLRQILMNLVHNSIKFTESGRVELAVSCRERRADLARIRCEVTDTGIGIEAAALERLFMPFTQADSSTTRRFGGTGLGLSIVRNVAELMGGEIGVTSTLGVGSKFWVEIPLRVAGLEVGMDSANRLRSLQIWVADSAGDTPDGVGAIVRALGWIPQIVDTGERLIELLRSAPLDARPDVLIVDLDLTGRDAHQLITRLGKEIDRGELPPILLVTDRPQSYGEFAKFLRASDVVLVRPVTSSALFNAVNSAVWRRFDDEERILRFAKFDEMRTQWLSGVRILVVDDSDINLEVAQRILEKQGASVRVCSDGRAALETVRMHHQDLDVVLMDVQMPVLDGNEATRRIRGELGLAALPIVALTAGALVAERQRAVEAGMNDFITKPFDPQVLIRKVRYVVEQARGRPIPLVTNTPPHPGAAFDLSLMSSIDMGMVRRSFGDDLSLFKLLLPRMLREFADLTLPLAVLPDDAATRAALRARTHKLKGSAGMLGALHVMRFAGAAEKALADEQRADVVEAVLARLAAQLTTLREEAESLALTWAAGEAAAPQVPPKRLHLSDSDFDDLCALLDSQNLAAVDKFDSISLPLRETLESERFERLKAAIDSLEFQRGADLLRGARPLVTML